MGENTRDPRIQEHVVTVHLAEADALISLGTLLIEGLRHIVPSASADPAPPVEGPYDLGLEPWSFHDPQQGCDVVAYLDPQNQIRHVPVTRATEVPKTWKRIWLENRT